MLPIIKKHQELFPAPSPTSSTPSTPSVSRTPSVKVQPTPTPSPVSKSKAAEPRLSPYGPSYGTRAAIRPEDIGKKGRTPPTPTSPGFGGGGDALGALLSSSYKNKSRERDGKKEKVMPKVMMTPF